MSSLSPSDSQLQQLVQEIRQLQTATDPRQKKRCRRAGMELHQLVSQNLGALQRKLYHEFAGTIGKELFEECYRDGLAKAWLEFLTDYDPAKGAVISWFYQFLRWRFLDSKNTYSNMRRTRKGLVYDTSFDQNLNNNSDSGTTLIDLLPAPADTSSVPENSTILKNLIEADEYHIFTNRHLRNLPQVNYRTIALERIQDKSWNDIAKIYDVPIGTITPFFTRSHSYFCPFFWESIQGEFTLSEDLQKIIREDKDNLFKGKRFKIKTANAQSTIITSFQEIVIKKLENKGLSWGTLGTSFTLDQQGTQDMLYFYLDCIASFKAVFVSQFCLV